MPARPHTYILAELVAEHGWTSGAEIGVFRGDTLFHLLDEFPALSMIGADKWQNLNRKSYGRFDLPPIGQRVRGKAMLYGDRCRILHMDSVKAAEFVEDESLDFVFVDAFHSYEACHADIVAWMPKVKPGGYVTGHDWHWDTVRRALNELLPGWVEYDEHVWARAKIA